MADGNEPKKTSSRNLSIEGLRGIAAFLVLVSHINGIAVDRGFAPSWQVYFDTHILNKAGAFGVCAFFCISGYLIIQSLARAKSLGDFALNRVRRIYPLFATLHLIAFPLALVLESDLTPLKGQPIRLIQEFFANLFFIPGIFDTPIAQKNAWTLSYEAAFYITSGAIFWGLLRMKNRSLGWMLALAGLVAIGAIVWFRPFFWFFGAGVAAYALFDGKEEAPVWMKFAPVGLALMILNYLLLPKGAHSASYTTDNPVLWPISYILGFLFFSTLIFEQGWLASFLRLPALQFLGAISYSLYIVHPFVLHALRLVIGKLPDSIGPIVFLVLGLVLSVWVSKLTFDWLEVWLAKKLFPKKPAKAAG
jgi:peptidoglycan/LPS O-acetylase OafA/YrhL